MPGAVDDALLGIEGLVGDQYVGLHLGQQVVRADEVVCFATGQVEADGVTEGIH